jgi:hypothetical protein
MSSSVNRSAGKGPICPVPSNAPGGNAGDIWLYTAIAGDRDGAIVNGAQALIGNRSLSGQSYSHASINVTDTVLFTADGQGLHFQDQADMIETISDNGRRIDVMRPIAGGFDSSAATAYATGQASQPGNQYILNLVGGVPGVCSTAAAAAARAGGLPIGDRFTTPNDLANDPLLVRVGSYDGGRRLCLPAPPLALKPPAVG